MTEHKGITTNIETFNFTGHQFRAVTIDGNPWFVAADVCRVLGIHVKADGKLNITVALNKLAADEKGSYPIGTLGGPQRMSIVSESGLYKLIMRSDKPIALEFRDWVTREVLPAIRKDGMYVQGEEKVRTGCQKRNPTEINDSKRTSRAPDEKGLKRIKIPGGEVHPKLRTGGNLVRPQNDFKRISRAPGGAAYAVLRSCNSPTSLPINEVSRR